MKRSSRIHQYIKRFGPLLIVGVLIMGLVSCDGSCSSTPAEYELNTSSSGGGDVVISGEGTYADGTIVTIEAVPDECYEFVQWTGADVADPYSPITTITMDEAKSITAVFALLSYSLTTDSTDGGAITSPGEDTFTYNCGTDVPLVATAEEGYYFVEWSGDVDTIANVNGYTTTITMMGDYFITANFELVPPEHFVLTTSSTTGGSVTTPGEESAPYDEGTVVNLVATPDAYYGFIEWTGDVGTIVDVYAASTTITMNGDYSITANFSLFAGGNGTAENPYQIADWYHLDNVRNYLSSHFIVINDLDSNSIGYTELASATANEGKGWQPIGSTAVDDAFVGNFDGQGYEIHDLFIDRPNEPDVGLFGVVEELGVIENVGVVNGNVTGNGDAGGLVGKNQGTVSNSYASGNVTGDLNVGGLVGWNFEGTVSQTFAIGNITGLDNVGGLVGWNTGTMSNSYATGGVTGNTSAGGLTGKNAGPVSNSYASGSVTGYDNVGGLVGKNDNTGTVSNSYSTGNVTGELHVGGLMGRNQGTESNSFWDTQTSGQDSSDGGTGKTTVEMQDIATFTDAGWNITAVDPGETIPTHTWNIVDTVTYPFLSWQSVA